MKLGITGFPLAYTQSPKLHKRFLREAGLSGSYDVLPFDPMRGKREFFKFLDSLASAGYVGINVTIPLKEWAYEYAVKRGRGASAGFHGACASSVRAANTLIFKKSGAECANTDAFGLWTDVGNWLKTRRLKPLAAKMNVVVVGTGGSARGAIAGILVGHPATRRILQVSVKGRNRSKARALQRLIPRRPSKAPAEAVLVLWCLAPVTQAEAKAVWNDLRPLIADRTVFLYDLNYGERAEATEKLLPSNRRRTGKGMLLEQARCSFELWKAAARSKLQKMPRS